MIKVLSRLILFSLFLFEASHQDGFQKDLDTNLPFPPTLEFRSGIPTGHLRPLGWQNRPESAVNEESVSLQPEQFWDLYVNLSKPTVIRGLILGSEPTDRWTDNYLNKNFGKSDIKVMRRVQKQKSIEETNLQMTFKSFLQGYRVEDWYLRGIMPKEMFEEVPIPHIVNCGALTQEPKIAQLIEPYLWMSAGETSSLLHSHPEHNLHCVLDGRKDFILIPSEQFGSNSEWKKTLGMYETYPHSSEWYSKIDVNMVNAFKYDLSKLVWYWALLRAGDCVYIPANYLHQVRSHGRSISASIYFTPLQSETKDEEYLSSIKKKVFSKCSKNAPLFELAPSYGSHFMWVYTHSERHLNQRNVQIKDARRYMLCLMRNEEKLYFERFNNFYNEITEEIKSENENETAEVKELAKLSSSDVWSDFSNGKEMKFLSVSDIYGLKERNLSRFVKILNAVASYHDVKSAQAKSIRDEL